MELATTMTQISLDHPNISIKEILIGMINLEITMGTILGFMLGVISLLRGLM